MSETKLYVIHAHCNECGEGKSFDAGNSSKEGPDLRSLALDKANSWRGTHRALHNRSHRQPLSK